jgi:lipopolysaccharide transport system ATP-binding protein
MFWALRDVSFQLQQGEVVGVIGRNGAGKSTLLKILSRITRPTTGAVEIVGRVGSLLEVGTGFHPELTGRENIFLNGAIIGMLRREIQAKFDEIVAFAEVERFLDTPVKYYSSGMYMRLAFAVAAHLEPDVLIVDEVLAVGDAAFQKKCMGKMSDVTSRGNTVLFVSHNMGAVSRLCQHAIWLDNGNLVDMGPTGAIVPRYLLENTSENGQCAWPEGTALAGVRELKFHGATLRNAAGEIAANIDVRLPFTLTIDYRIHERLGQCRVGFMLNTPDGTVLFEAYDSDQPENQGRREIGTYSIRCEIPGNLLLPGRYTLSLVAGSPGYKPLVYEEHAMSIMLEDTGAVGSEMQVERIGVFRPKLKWERA